MMKITYVLGLTLLLISCNSSEKKKELSVVTISEENINQQSSALKESIIRGKSIYDDFCVSCHLPNGKGVPKAFPPLANSDYLKNNRAKSLKAIKYGQSGEITVNGQKYNGVMSPLGLENNEIADVMNYITNSWGNSNDKLTTVDEVSKIEP
ncbi:c-type cytochrome [Psychroserpens damuponensis]|uniref:c-type cytochrome n=1 Tax=Psychroserpens damuponensis TaxID=943936 RepID=UPI000A011FDA|nr:cytochrome c [Psychroserpens damuponensis]